MYEQEVFLWLPVEEEATFALEQFLPAVSCLGLVTREGEPGPQAFSVSNMEAQPRARGGAGQDGTVHSMN